MLRKALISDSSIKILLCDWPVMANESVSEQNWTSVQLNLVLDFDEDNEMIKLLKPLISQNLDGRILTEWLKEVYDEVRVFLQSGS